MLHNPKTIAQLSASLRPVAKYGKKPRPWSLQFKSVPSRNEADYYAEVCAKLEPTPAQ